MESWFAQNQVLVLLAKNRFLNGVSHAAAVLGLSQPSSFSVGFQRLNILKADTRIPEGYTMTADLGKGVGDSIKKQNLQTCARLIPLLISFNSNPFVMVPQLSY